MKTLLAAVAVASLSMVAFADEPKKETKKESCKMECCKKAKTDCKQCPDCSKKTAH